MSFLYMGSHGMLKFVYLIELKLLVQGFMSTMIHGIFTMLDTSHMTYNTKYGI